MDDPELLRLRASQCRWRLDDGRVLNAAQAIDELVGCGVASIFKRRNGDAVESFLAIRGCEGAFALHDHDATLHYAQHALQRRALRIRSGAISQSNTGG